MVIQKIKYNQGGLSAIEERKVMIGALQQTRQDVICELFKLIPRDKIDKIFSESNTATAELNYTFLGFEKVYKAVTMFVPKSKIIIDLGCGYAFQSWYFKDYKKYIGVDCSTSYTDVLKTENSQFFFMSIQKFIKEQFLKLEYKKEDIFAVCSYVPDEKARMMVKEYFPYCLVYYP